MATGNDCSLSLGEIRRRVIRITYADLVVAATTKNISDPTGALPANAVVVGSQVEVVTAFGGATVTAIQLDVGDSDDDNSVIAAMEVMSGVSAGRRQKAGARAAGKDSATTLIAKCTATGGNFGDGTTSNLTAGEVHVHILYALVGDDVAGAT